MFTNSIDNKNTYILDDGTEVKDLAASIFKKGVAVTDIGEMMQVSSEFEMRPDLISKALYGSTDYAEMVMKYSIIQNPFSIERGDIIYNAALSYIYYPVAEDIVNQDKIFDAVKNYHKYIDKSKLPDKPGSEKESIEIKEADKEANISETGSTGITISNGKIYFGEIDEDLKTADTSLVECATDGTTLGQFLTATLKNNN